MPNINLNARVALNPVAAGSPTHAEAAVEYVNLREVFRLDESIIVKVSGESMSPRISDGDYCIVNTHQTPQPGDTVVYRTDYNEFTVKQYIHDERKGLRLVPINSDYSEITSPGQLIGIVTWIFSKTGSLCRMHH